MRRLLPLAAALALAACGFHLQGAVALPARLASGYVAAPDAYTDFYAALTEAWRGAGGALAPAAAGAATVVTVHAEDAGQRVLSISARNTPREYEVYYTIEYSVSVDGKEVLPRQALSLARSYSFDETAVLAKEREERIIRESLARELAALVMRRVATL